jgi:hypothetical protein
MFNLILLLLSELDATIATVSVTCLADIALRRDCQMVVSTRSRSLVEMLIAAPLEQWKMRTMLATVLCSLAASGDDAVERNLMLAFSDEALRYVVLRTCLSLSLPEFVLQYNTLQYVRDVTTP